MTRRALLSMLALAALDPERLLWTPGRKLISIPKPQAVYFRFVPLPGHHVRIPPWNYIKSLEVLSRTGEVLSVHKVLPVNLPHNLRPLAQGSLIMDSIPYATIAVNLVGPFRTPLPPFADLRLWPGRTRA